MEKKIKSPDENKRLQNWQAKYSNAKTQYEPELEAMKVFQNYYDGDRKIMTKDGYAAKESSNTRNITFELIESEVESSIPMPKVTPVHEEDQEAAKHIEDMLKNEIKRCKLKVLNDSQERTAPVLGGSFYLVEWDNTKCYHCTFGDLLLQDIEPSQVIPQPGVTEIEQMDYIFIRTAQTREYVKRRFGVSVDDEAETDQEIRGDVKSDDIVTVITAYYKNTDGGIGIYRWCGDTELENFEDYQARHLERCKKCGRVKTDKVCECGSKAFENVVDDIATIDITRGMTSAIDAQTGALVVSELTEKVEIPYYKPNQFPIILRKNITRKKHLLGYSDAQVIADQQDAIKKYGTKIDEKLLKGGSYITLPEGIGLETTDEELKIIRIGSPQQKSMIDVLTVQADTTQDRMVLETNYQWAKSALGITDSFQGKYDSSATSGTAKQYSINQAAGRLESKRVMKNESYAALYELMFKFMLAYADDPIPLQSDGMNGEKEFSHFDKKEFLKQDSAGTWYWNDEFIFEIDPTSTLLTNREAMWNQADIKLQSGAYGPLSDMETNHLYWLEQERNGYPHAGEIREEIDKRIAARAQMQEGMIANEMPGM